MDNEILLLQQIDRQNNVIDVLLTENACLKQIIQTYLLSTDIAAKPELALLRMMLETSGNLTSSAGISEGNMGNRNAFADTRGGNINNPISFANNSKGNSGNQNAFANKSKGNNGSRTAVAANDEALTNENIARVAHQLRPFMKYASLTSQMNTAKILWQLYLDATTPLSELRSLSGLSQDGMAKRIMALKKAGLIVRRSAPLRYELTEKGRDLLAV